MATFLIYLSDPQDGGETIFKREGLGSAWGRSGGGSKMGCRGEAAREKQRGTVRGGKRGRWDSTKKGEL